LAAPSVLVDSEERHYPLHCRRELSDAGFSGGASALSSFALVPLPAVLALSAMLALLVINHWIRASLVAPRVFERGEPDGLRWREVRTPQQFSIQNLGELSEEKQLKSPSNLMY
jgi:hypothetical protein